ncbi:MAG: hypothetical protein KKH28_03900 [Elusimicrobia bacterium]|nr:hypothetical protein [Elusimicrobiota bacterium]
MENKNSSPYTLYPIPYTLPSLRFCALALLCSCALIFILKPISTAQFGQAAEDQVFDYDPQPGDREPQLASATVSVDYADAEIISDRAGGVIMFVKDRWKNWVARAVYLLMLDVTLLIIMLSLPRNEEYYIIIAYILSGASALLSFWAFLCAALLFKLHSASWIYILPLSMVMVVMTGVVLMKIKRSDTSLSELKESFQKLSNAPTEDARLISIEGVPGDWPDKDFLQ